MRKARKPDPTKPEVWLRNFSLDLKSRPKRSLALLRPVGLTHLMERRQKSRKNLGLLR